MSKMYSVSDIANGCVKVEPTEETPCNGPSNQMVFTGEFPVVKKEKTETSCNMVGQETIPLPLESDYPVHSLGETSTQDDVLNIQIINVQGTPPFRNGFKDEIKIGDQLENQLNKSPCSDGSNPELQSSFDYGTQKNMPMAQEYRNGQLVKQTVTQNEMYPVETELRSPINQSSFYNKMPLAETAEKEKGLSHQLNSHQIEPSRLLSHQAYSLPMSYQHPFPVYQMSTNGTMPAHQFDTPNGSPEIESSCQMDTNGFARSDISSHATVPLYHMDTAQEEMTTAQMGDMSMKKDARYQAANYHYQPEMSFFHGGHNNHESLKVQTFHQKQIYDAGPTRHRSASCQCCCHSPTQSESFYIPSPALENQRPSVIMVPVSRSNTASGSHVPLKVNTPYSFPSQNRRNFANSLGYSNDSDSSDEDEDRKQDKYFRIVIDGTTARFKLTPEEWERIPINTFPSGGRLLSGDWTKIFLEKVKESNPWCSLRFKNNHVRSENSRKIHSAVFFRGGAECKRPECHVKVRFVIQKEKGKYVDVTYVGNVCHSSQPGGSDVTNDKKTNKRVRRTYSS